MSDVLRRIITRFEAQPGNVRAVLGGVGQSYSQAATGANRLAREQSYLNNQLRAFGTTMRYAIAGGAVFGAAGTIATLSQIQTQLGQISALSGLAGVRGPGGASIALVGQSLEDLSSQVRRASIDVVQPVQNINEAILNLLSTSQGLRQNEIVPIVEEMARGATLAQTPIDQLTQAAASMNVAFQQTPSLANFRKFSREWFTLIGLAPGVRAAGPQILTQFAPLASLMRQGRGTQEQMMALTLGGVRFGGSPSTALRGLQYLVQSIETPSKQGAKALAQIGVTPDVVQSQGIWNALMMVLKYVRSTSAGQLSTQQLKNIGGMTDEQLDMVDPGKLPPSMVSGAGATWLRQALGRIHAIRAAIILAQQVEPHGDVASLFQDLGKFTDENGQQLDEYRKGWNRFLKEAKLPQAAVAIQTLGTDIAVAFEPILNLGARGVSGLGKQVTAHPGATQAAVISAGIAAGAYGLLRGFGGLKGLGRLGGRGLPIAGAISDLPGASGQWKGMPGESAIHPMYVMVVANLSGRGGVPVPVGGGVPVPGEEPPTGGTMGKFGRLGRGGARLLGWAGVGIMAAELLKYAGDKVPHWRDDPGTSMRKQNRVFLGSKGAAEYWYDPQTKKFTLTQEGAKLNIGEKTVAQGVGKSVAQLDRIIAQGGAALKGQAKVDMNINMKQPDGQVVKKKASVTVDMFSHFQDTPFKAPTSRGQSKTSRG